MANCDSAAVAIDAPRFAVDVTFANQCAQVFGGYVGQGGASHPVGWHLLPVQFVRGGAQLGFQVRRASPDRPHHKQAKEAKAPCGSGGRGLGTLFSSASRVPVCGSGHSL
jgi:hypothetical protein